MGRSPRGASGKCNTMLSFSAKFMLQGCFTTLKPKFAPYVLLHCFALHWIGWVYADCTHKNDWQHASIMYACLGMHLFCIAYTICPWCMRQGFAMPKMHSWLQAKHRHPALRPETAALSLRDVSLTVSRGTGENWRACSCFWGLTAWLFRVLSVVCEPVKLLTCSSKHWPLICSCMVLLVQLQAGCSDYVCNVLLWSCL